MTISSVSIPAISKPNVPFPTSWGGVSSKAT